MMHKQIQPLTARYLNPALISFNIRYEKHPVTHRQIQRARSTRLQQSLPILYALAQPLRDDLEGHELRCCVNRSLGHDYRLLRVDGEAREPGPIFHELEGEVGERVAFEGQRLGMVK